MNPRTLVLAAAICVSGAGSAGAASVVVDPAAGGDFSFTWFGGLGRIDEIDNTGSAEWSLSLASGAVWIISVSDAFAPGDEFALVLDDQIVPWDETDIVNNFFTAFAARFLAPGSHRITLDVTARAADSTVGRAFASLRPADLPQVPLPATLPLLAGALTAFGFAGSRRKRRAH